MTQADSFDGDVAIVTGSTSGVGKAIALELADRGADVVVNGLTQEKGRRLVDEIEDGGQRARFVRADITDYGEMERLVETAVDELGGLDILVGSGGATGKDVMPDFFRDQDPSDHPEFVETHYLGRIYPIKAALEPMIETGGGRIVNISSDAGRVPTPGESGVGGPFAAVMMATRALAQELARWDIRVNTVSVSVVADTPGLDRDLAESEMSHVFEKALELQDFPVSSEDIAEAAAFLAGERPITGQILSVNGGVSFPG